VSVSERSVVDSDANERLRSYLTELIKRFREKAKTLPVETQVMLPKTLVDFSSPCQILVIWAKEPEFQIIIITHLRELGDEHIEIHGPIENSSLLDYIENQVLSLDIINRLGRDTVEDFIAWSIQRLQGHYGPLSSPRPSESKILVQTKLNFYGPHAVGWLVLGNLLRCDVSELIDGCFRDLTTKTPLSAPLPEEKVILEGFGTYIRPPVWIGKVPRFKEKVWILSSDFPWFLSERVIVDVYKGVPFIALRDGYIAIGVKERSKALELLNEIAAALLLLGIPVYTIREAAVGGALFMEKIALRSPIDPHRSLIFRPVVDERKLKDALKLAELITTNEKVKTFILLFHEAFSHFKGSEYKQALIMSWAILEEYIDDLLISSLPKITSDKNRLNKILKNWNVDQKLEVLDISNVIPSDEYNLLMKIKRARNKLVHEGKKPEKELVEKSLEIAENYVRELLKRFFADPKLLSLIRFPKI
jgi:hypothetical protein